MKIFSFNLGIIWIITIVHCGECFEAGWSGFIPFTSTSTSPDGTTHYAITECALLRIGADYMKAVYGSSELDSVGSSTGICSKVKDDFAAIKKEADRLHVSSIFRLVVYTISTANVFIDAREFYSERSHFDSESFTKASGLVGLRLDFAAAQLIEDELYTARNAFGEAMHTMQDFYAHSNWIELGRNQPNAYIGSGTALGIYAPLNVRTCRNCTDKDCAKSNILPEIIENGWLTSGYFSYFSLLANKPKGKCSHGGPNDNTTTQDAVGYGINKDSASSDHGTFFHYEAARVAYEATRQSLLNLWAQVGNDRFGRFLGFKTTSLAFVIDTTGSMAPYIELVKNMAIRILESTTGESAIFRPHTYILSPFNDPNFGPLTVTTNLEELIDAISSLSAGGGGDIPELYYHGVDAALNACERDSSLFTFTDAPAKDAYLRSKVLIRASDLNIRVYSFYASGISGRRKRQFFGTNDGEELLDGSDGRDFAMATGGYTIGIQPGDDNATAEYVIRRLERTQPLLVINVPQPTNLTFQVDDTMTVLSIDISSTTTLTNFVELTDPTGEYLKPMPITASNFFQLYTIRNLTAGSWTLHSNYINRHNIELSSDSPISCTTTLCEKQIGKLSIEYMPLTNAPTVNQTDLVLITICENLPADIRNGSVVLVDNLGIKINEFHSSALGQNGFMTPIEIPDVDFRLLTIVNLVNGSQFQRQTARLISPTLIKIDIINQPYILIGNDTLNISFTIYNQAQIALNITLCITDTLRLLNTNERCNMPYQINSLNNVTDQLMVSNEFYTNKTNNTISTFTFTITAFDDDGNTSKKISNYNTMTLYIEDEPYEETSFPTDVPSMTTSITSTITTTSTVTTTSTRSLTTTEENSNRIILLVPLCSN